MLKIQVTVKRLVSKGRKDIMLGCFILGVVVGVTLTVTTIALCIKNSGY